MIINKYNTGGGSASGGTMGPQGPQGPQGPAGAGDPSEVQDMIDASLLAFGAELEEGDPIVGMAAQLYSPDGVSVEGLMNYRTTAGDESVSSTIAELRKIEGNSIYPEPQYNDSASLERGGEAVTGFTYDIEWGVFSRWQETSVSTDISSYNSKVYKITNIQDSNVYLHFFTSDGLDVAVEYQPSGNIGWRVNKNCTKVDDTHFSFDGGLIDCSLSSTIATITGETGSWGSARADLGAVGGYFFLVDVNIPNDIPNGTSVYTYDSGWTPSLPQALQNMQVDSVDYVPQDGDEITIVRNLEKEGRAQFAAPKEFVAVGFNSFNKSGNTLISQYTEDNGVYSVAIYAVANLNDGYVIYDENSGITAVGISDSATGTMDTTGVVLGEVVSVVYPTSEKPYVLVTTTDIDGLCIHPRWSGIKDEEYEEYSESKIDGLLQYVDICPMWSVGNVRNIIDLENGKLINNIGSESYSAARVNELLASGYTLGTDFEFDDTLIYIVRDEPVVTSISVSNYEYKANDFSVEYFADANSIISTKVYADTYYMNNLVDKLRNMEGLVHLDTLNGHTGDANTLYEYNGNLYMWNDSAGYVAEWLKSIELTEGNEGTGLIYSNIPDGQKLFEFKYSYGGDWRYVVMSGDTLVLTETGGSIVTAVTYGNTFQFGATSSPNSRYIKGIYKTNYIGFNKSDYVSIQNVWNGSVSGGHWELVDKYNYPYMEESAGIVKYNTKGQVVRKISDTSIKEIQFNTNANQFSSTGKIAFFTDGTNNGPSKMYVPTAGGTDGQILISKGDNAAPEFTNWIKSVQITSDAYDALVQAGTTDPNTLYLIVDE